MSNQVGERLFKSDPLFRQEEEEEEEKEEKEQEKEQEWSGEKVENDSIGRSEFVVTPLFIEDTEGPVDAGELLRRMRRMRREKKRGGDSR